jgi:hypothetical protein
MCGFSESDTYRIWAPGGLATALVAEREEAERVGASESDWECVMREIQERRDFNASSLP